MSATDTSELHTPPKCFRLKDGSTEYHFLEAVRSIIRACGGNRQIARGIAIELVKEETERRT